MTSDVTTWIVGLDLHPSGAGAIRFARELVARRDCDDELRGIHVLEEAYLRSVLKYHHLDEVTEGAQNAATVAVEAAAASGHFASISVVEGMTPEKALDDLAETLPSSRLILGRQAKKDGAELFRLGRVARRLLRSLGRPTFVVPPDYDPSGADGPVVASVSLREDCETSAVFARDLAASVGRKLVLAHVVPTPDDYAAHYLPDASLEKMRADNQRSAEAELTRWAAQSGCADAECVVLQGGIVERLVELSTERRAFALISGSRQLSTFERILLTSIASQVAARAECPVAVVPPK